MAHPTSIPEFQAALHALPGEDTSEAVTAAFNAAMASPSIVVHCEAILDGLKAHVATLSLPAARVLAGACHLVLRHHYLGREDEADALRELARARIAELEAALPLPPVQPDPPEPEAEGQ